MTNAQVGAVAGDTDMYPITVVTETESGMRGCWEQYKQSTGN